MTKVCPIMSKVIHEPQYESNGYIHMALTSLHKVYCLKEECESWDCNYEFCKLIGWDE